MAYKKVFLNTYEEAPQHTKYRFAELELMKAMPQLTLLFGSREAATEELFKILGVQEKFLFEKKEDFFKMCSSFRFLHPPKEEWIRYFIMYGQSYGTIRKLTSASFNYIAKLRYGFPHYYPIFSHWEPYMLQRWQIVKPMFNLFNETLIHTTPATEEDVEPDNYNYDYDYNNE